MKKLFSFTEYLKESKFFESDEMGLNVADQPSDTSKDSDTENPKNVEKPGEGATAVVGEEESTGIEVVDAPAEPKKEEDEAPKPVDKAGETAVEVEESLELAADIFEQLIAENLIDGINEDEDEEDEALEPDTEGAKKITEVPEEEEFVADKTKEGEPSEEKKAELEESEYFEILESLEELAEKKLWTGNRSWGLGAGSWKPSSWGGSGKMDKVQKLRKLAGQKAAIEKTTGSSKAGKFAAKTIVSVKNMPKWKWIALGLAGVAAYRKIKKSIAVRKQKEALLAGIKDPKQRELEKAKLDKLKNSEVLAIRQLSDKADKAEAKYLAADAETKEKMRIEKAKAQKELAKQY